MEKDKLKKILSAISNSDVGIKGAFKSVEKEMQKVADNLRTDVEMKTFEMAKKRIAEIKEQIQLIFDYLDTLKEDLKKSENDLTSSLNQKSFDLKSKIVEYRNANLERLQTLSVEMDELRRDIKEISKTKVGTLDYENQIKRVENELEKSIFKLKKETESEIEKSLTETKKTIGAFEEEFKKLRRDVMTTMGSRGGGGSGYVNPITLSEISTPSAFPQSNTGFIYLKDDAGASMAYFMSDNGTEYPWGTGGGGGGTPGGSDTQVQFNDGGAFGGDAGMTYNKTTDTLTLVGDIYANLFHSDGWKFNNNGDLEFYSDEEITHLVSIFAAGAMQIAIGTGTVAGVLDMSTITGLANRVYTFPDIAGSTIVVSEGAQTINGVKTFSSLPISSATPTIGTEFTTKTYVDTLFGSGARFVDAVNAATTAALAANTYNNGSSGVGATLTGNANGAFETVDGVAAALNNKYLVKNEATGANNGAYLLTQVGDGSNPYILTRMVGYDTSTEIVGGTFFNILAGTENGNEQWSLTTTGTIIVGTTSLTFAQLSSPTTYTGSLGVELVGNDFRADLLATGAIGLTGNELKVNVSGALSISGNNVIVSALGITNAMLAGSIADSKLSAITTAGKVSGAALTLLPNTPSGAGKLPIANIASGTPDGTKFVRDDGTLAIPSGLGSGVASINYTKNLTSDTSETTVANTTTETTIYTYAVPGGTLGTDKALRITVTGTYTNTSGATRTLRLRLFYGGTAVANGIVNMLSAAIASAAGTGNFTAEFYLLSNGATNAQTGRGVGTVFGGTSGPVVFGAAGNQRAIDSTASQNIIIRVQHSVASTTTSLTSQLMIVEQLNATDTIGAPIDAPYWLSTANADLSAEVNLGALTTGLLKHTVAAGVSTPATATPGTDYYNPGGTDVAVADGGTGVSTLTTAYGLLAAGTTATGNVQTLAAGLTTQILVGGGASALPAWGADLPTAVTIGSSYIYRVGGTDVSLADGGTGASLSDPNADRLLFWDDSETSTAFLTPNVGLSISATNLNVIRTFVVHYQDVLAEDTASILAIRPFRDETVTSFVAQPDVPRNIAVVLLPGVPGSASGTVTINGTDADGATIQEVITFTNEATTKYTSKAFALITSIVTDSTDADIATYSVGISDTLGLPNYPFNATTDVFKVKKNNADYNIISVTINATNGTVTFDGPISGGDDYTIWYRPFR